MRKIPKVKLLCQTYIVAISKIISKLTSIEIIPIYNPTSNIHAWSVTCTLPPNCILPVFFIFVNLISGKYFLGIGIFFNLSCMKFIIFSSV